MKEKFNLKKRILIGLVLLGIMFSFYCIFNVISVIADFSGETQGLKLFDSNIDYMGVTSANNQKTFYAESVDRWYSFYLYLSSITFVLTYSYSDVGDITAFNDGGALVGLSAIGESSFNIVGNLFSSVWDNENEIGHLVFIDWDTGQTLNYRNFTISPEGSLDFGVNRELDGDFSLIGIALTLTNLNYPVIVYGGYEEDYVLYASMCESIDGYNDDWKTISFVSRDNFRKFLGIVPTGDRSVMIFDADSATSLPLLMYSCDFVTTSNGTTGTIYSDNDIYHFSPSSITENYAVFSVAYNLTHGCIAYTDYSAEDTVYAFTFDFATKTRSDEYLVFSSGNRIFPSVTMDTNEFFIIGYEDRFGEVTEAIIMNEYSNGYETPFNITGATYLFENIPYTVSNTHTINADITSNSDGIVLFVYGADDDTYYSYITIEGEYTGNGNGDEEEDEEFDFWFFKWILALIVFIVIVSFAIYVKGGKR